LNLFSKEKKEPENNQTNPNFGVSPQDIGVSPTTESQQKFNSSFGGKTTKRRRNKTTKRRLRKTARK
jgi:hypothetical protein